MATKKNRSTPLLRSLSHHISNASEKMNIKQAADVLFACCQLNYPDEILLDKVAEDILLIIKDVEKSTVCFSIIKSIGILRYRNKDLLDAMSVWLIDKDINAREFSMVLFTLANVNYKPLNFDSLIENFSSTLKVATNDEKIDSAWALIAMDHTDIQLITSVLDSKFVAKYSENLPTKIKLLNINAYAKMLGKKYKGPLLHESLDIFNLAMTRTKDKQVLLDSILETIGNIFPLNECVKTDLDHNMGFLKDAEFFLDSNFNVVKFSDVREDDKNFSKVALMVVGFHDLCRGRGTKLNGIAALTYKLLSKSGYKILCVPYFEFSKSDKLVVRVQYISEKLRTLDGGIGDLL